MRETSATPIGRSRLEYHLEREANTLRISGLSRNDVFAMLGEGVLYHTITTDNAQAERAWRIPGVNNFGKIDATHGLLELQLQPSTSDLYPLTTRLHELMTAIYEQRQHGETRLH